MNIGKEKRRIIVEPLEQPKRAPKRVPAPAPEKALTANQAARHPWLVDYDSPVRQPQM
jgi:hypothetical protein